MGEIIAGIVAIVGATAWLVRLESKVTALEQRVNRWQLKNLIKEAMEREGDQ